jgi:hypothetical protein
MKLTPVSGTRALSSLFLPLRAAWTLDRRAAILAFLEVVAAALTSLLPLDFGLMVGGAATQSPRPLIVGGVLAASALGVVPVFTSIGVEARLRS